MKRLLGVLAVTLFLVSCLSGLATNVLYQYDIANKVQVSEEAPQPLQKIDLKTSQQRTVGWYYKFSDTAPVVIFHHGNASNIQGVVDSGFTEKLKSMKVNFVIFDYPKYGLSTGELNQNGVVAASQAVFDFTKEKFPRSEIVIWGRSLGCGPATIMAANNPSASKLILTSPWNSFWKLAKHKGNLSDKNAKSAAKGNEYESEVHAQKIHIPVLIHHGTVDDVIPWNMGKDLSGKFASSDVTFISLEGKGHNNLLGDQEWEEIAQFVRY